MHEAFIYDGGRSAVGRYGGCLSSVRPDDLLAHVIRALHQRLPFALDDYEDVIIGNTNQAGEDSRNVARHAGLLAGLPEKSGGLTVNRLCGSGLAAALDAARCIRAGEGELFIAGGVECMSRAPLVLSKSTSAFDRGQVLADSTLGARFGNPKITAGFGSDTMPQTADNIAADLHISRDDSDRFAEGSQHKYQAALQRGFYADEILPIEVSVGRNQTATVNADEHPRADASFEALQKLKPLSEGGVVTAGGITLDGSGDQPFLQAELRLSEVELSAVLPGRGIEGNLEGNLGTISLNVDQASASGELTARVFDGIVKAFEGDIFKGYPSSGLFIEIIQRFHQSPEAVRFIDRHDFIALFIIRGVE